MKSNSFHKFSNSASHVATIRNPLLSFLLFIILLPGLISCGRTGMYSIVLTNPGVQDDRNNLNDLPEPYHKKKVTVPSSIALMSDDARKKLPNELSNMVVYKVDTTVKIDILSQPGVATIKASACNNNGIALVLHDSSEVKRKGKEIAVALRYVCVDDSPDVLWAATEYYKIDYADVCPAGLHTIEYQFFSPRVLKNQKSPKLMRVMTVCVDP